ncbi:integrin alpha-E-like isoform X2 [Narcine bancroftii]|uniref:integrin alpha-E-like isoform X2 n=1 Tax=Narcine bancroftii TaxID=1343680 RepID=UPI003831A0C0
MLIGYDKARAPKAVNTFNIDTKLKVLFQNKNDVLFGQKVLQYSHGESSGILVTSPLYTNDNRHYGKIEKCDVKRKRCESIKFPEADKSLSGPGFTLAHTFIQSQILLCRQQRKRLQKNREDLNGICRELFSDLQEKYTFETSSFVSEIAKQDDNDNNNNNNNNPNAGNEKENEDDEFPGTEIAFVLDGSGSIKPGDFQIAKDFIINITRNIWKKCIECEFALVQYGKEIKTIFNLKDSQELSSGIFSTVRNMSQLGKVTKTASAIQHVLDNLFNEAQGSKKNARQFIVVITDGDIFQDEMKLSDVINSPKIAKVTRIAVGVGGSVNKEKALNELKLIASDPDEKHLFQVDNYSALADLLVDLEENIVGIEGTRGANISAFHMELAQIGFSADYSSDGNILLGAVGAFDWTGGVMMYNRDKRTVQFLNESKGTLSAACGYLGYSVTGAKRINGQQLYIAGAPRHSHTGQVIVFEAGTPVKIKQHIAGKQLGSYFGSELCPLDINGDLVTDFLLVGAPFFHIRGEEGIVYVYHLNEQGTFDDESCLAGAVSVPNARFGFAIANIGDINRDGYNDVAIGAPLEEDHCGSLYIFNGKNDGIHKMYSQRIKGKDVTIGLLYFGQSIDGSSDVDADGLLDITVSAKDNVIVLSSRPVIIIEVNVAFSPKMVPLSFESSDEPEKIIQVSVCFTTATKFGLLDLNNSFANYTINLDTKQKNKRVMFTKNDEMPDSLCDSVRLSTVFCRNYSITVQPCTIDCVSAIEIEVRYMLHNIGEDTQLPLPVLDKFIDHSATFELQFQKDCGSDNICNANLTLECYLPDNFIWIVGKTEKVSLKILLSNTGEDSYLTSMDVSYPENFDFKEISKPLPSQLINVECTNQETASSLSFLNCEIFHPVFKRTSEAELTISWDLGVTPFKEEFATISINVSNKNGHSDFVQWTHSIPMKHRLNVFLKPLNQIMKVDIHDYDANRPVSFHFQVTMDNPYNASTNLIISIPVKVWGQEILKLHRESLKDCEEVRNILKQKVIHNERDKWDCNLEGCECLYFECMITTLKQDIIVTTNLATDNLKQLVKKRVDIVVSGSVSFDEKLYQETFDAKDLSHNVKIHMNVVNTPIFNVISLVVGSSVGGILLLLLLIFILYKCGFFKRNYNDKIGLTEETKE